jgi:hypothetical protein
MKSEHRPQHGKDHAPQSRGDGKAKPGKFSTDLRS